MWCGQADLATASTGEQHFTSIVQQSVPDIIAAAQILTLASDAGPLRALTISSSLKQADRTIG